MNEGMMSKTPAQEQPELRRLLAKFNEQLNIIESHTVAISNGLQVISNFHEPVDGKEECEVMSPNSLLDELHSAINMLSRYTNRLEFSVRHLNKIV